MCVSVCLCVCAETVLYSRIQKVTNQHVINLLVYHQPDPKQKACGLA